MDGLTTVLALICTVLITPVIDGWSADWASRAFIDVYGTSWVGLFRAAWFFVVGAAVFYAARAGLAIALTLFSSWAIYRFGLLPI